MYDSSADSLSGGKHETEFKTDLAIGSPKKLEERNHCCNNFSIPNGEGYDGI